MDHRQSIQILLDQIKTETGFALRHVQKMLDDMGNRSEYEFVAEHAHTAIARFNGRYRITNPIGVVPTDESMLRAIGSQIIIIAMSTSYMANPDMQGEEPVTPKEWEEMQFEMRVELILFDYLDEYLMIGAMHDFEVTSVIEALKKGKRELCEN